MRVRDKLFINGEWVTPHGTERRIITNAATGESIGEVVLADLADADAAVAAAKAAQQGWADTPPAKRAEYLREIGRQLTKRLPELVEVFSQEVGIVRAQSEAFQGMGVYLFDAYAKRAEEFEWKQQLTSSTLLHQPIGVVGLITAWNFPLVLQAVKVAPALAAGCPVILKPAELAPLEAYILAEAVEAAGLPAGVFNLLVGTGAEVGEALVVHDDVDMISFVGSTAVGKRIGALAAERVKKVSLELGGKSPAVILDDADFETAVNTAMVGITTANGQACGCLSRILVPRERLDDAAAIAKTFIENLPLGNPLAEGIGIGPMATETHRQRVESYIQSGIDEGATIIIGGVGRPEGLEEGNFIRPTVFVTDDSSIRIAQEEIFGPVQVILPYDDEAHAIEIANSTTYGLASSVFGTDTERMERVGSRLETGKVDYNSFTFDPDAPFGGWKQSGIGHMYGDQGFTEYLAIKTLTKIA